MVCGNAKDNNCLWSDCIQFCRLLEDSGVPLDSKWPYLILYLRGLKDNLYLSQVQKILMQETLVALFQSKDFTDDNYLKINKVIHHVFISPYEEKISEIARGATALTSEVYAILGEQRSQVISVSEAVDSEYKDGIDPNVIISNLRLALKDVVTKMENDSTTLAELSYKDSLTGLSNRRSFDEFMVKSVEIWLKTGIPVGLILFDIDFFKKFNDTYGHLVGDQVLRALAVQIRRIITHLEGKNTEFLAARYGGEEFALIVRGDLVSILETIAERLRFQIEKTPLRLRDTQDKVVEERIKVTVSVGVATIQREWESAHVNNLIDLADRALYTAKRSGRNCTVVYRPDEESSYINITVK